jgi:RHS repeat-associated protein
MGTPVNQTGNLPTFGFTGQLQDVTTNLIYLRARELDPTIGEFLSPDSTQPNSSGTQGYNQFSYSSENPTTLLDPSGHDLAGEYVGQNGTLAIRVSAAEQAFGIPSDFLIEIEFNAGTPLAGQGLGTYTAFGQQALIGFLRSFNALKVVAAGAFQIGF